jgi:hypothetical protein
MVVVARRTVLGAGVAAVLVPLITGAVGTSAGAAVGIGALRRAALEERTGSRVLVIGAGGRAGGTLERVDDLLRAPAGHPHAFRARLRFDDPAAAAAVLDGGLVDLELPGLRVSGAGLVSIGYPQEGTAVLLVDRRPPREHLAIPG